MNQLFRLAFAAICILNACGAAAATEYPFDRYKITSIYKGKSVYPDFKGRDREFASYKTRISDGIKVGVNFGGRYSIVKFGCGTGCSMAMISDVSTGRVYSFPRGGDDNLYMKLTFIPASTLVIARWYGEDENCVEEQLVWQNEKFDRVANKRIGDRDACLALD